tara:strand:- start:297 stop:614 length:318 start_codon:yes stop_codon:yes gene_type:complete
MKYLLPIFIVLFSMSTLANDKVRPGPHNKMGHTKQSSEEKEGTFFYKLFNDELDFMGSNNSNSTNVQSNDQVLSQIEKLADLKERGILTESEFNEKKSILLNKIQ